MCFVGRCRILLMYIWDRLIPIAKMKYETQTIQEIKKAKYIITNGKKSGYIYENERNIE